MEFGELSDGYYELWRCGNAIRGASGAVRVMLGWYGAAHQEAHMDPPTSDEIEASLGGDFL
jgi:hypothetical protein